MRFHICDYIIEMGLKDISYTLFNAFIFSVNRLFMVILDLQGPYCFCSDHCLSQIITFSLPEHTPNSPNLEYKSHLPKNVTIYCHCEFQPLGKGVLPYNSHILYCTFKSHYVHGFTELCWVSWHRPHPFPRCFFARCKFTKCHKPTFSNSSQAISSICTQLCRQHLWTLLTKSYQKNVDIPNNTQVIR